MNWEKKKTNRGCYSDRLETGKTDKALGYGSEQNLGLVYILFKYVAKDHILPR